MYCCNPVCICCVAAVVERGVKKHKYARKPMLFRVACIMAIAATLVGDQPDFSKAHARMKQWAEDYNKSHPYEEIFNRSHDHEYLKRYWHNFQESGSVCDAPRAGRPRNISKADALRAASLVKQGKWYTQRVGRQDITYIRYYTSIAHAVRECGELADICHRNSVSPEQLLAAMHHFDPTLVRRKIFLKHTFTPTELEQRMTYAQDMLTQMKANPDVLQNTIYIDEASIVISDKTKSDVHVWCEAHDLNFTDVCPIPLHKGEKIVVRWICAVTAHPAFANKGGLVYFEFTTGTTGIDRKVNKKWDGSNLTGQWKYQVGVLQ